MSDPVVEVFRLGVGLLRWPRPDWSLAWMCASRPLDGHDLTFETLRRLPSQCLIHFMLPGVCLVSLTFVLRSVIFETVLGVFQSWIR